MKPNNRPTYAPNGEEGWSVGFSPQHYRCIRCYFPKTRSERNVDTVTFFPAAIPFPKVSLNDFLRQAATDIISILTAPPSTTAHSLQAGDPTRNVLLEIATVLNRAEKLPVTSPPTSYVPPQRVKTVKKITTPPEPTVKMSPPTSRVKKKNPH